MISPVIIYKKKKCCCSREIVIVAHVSDMFPDVDIYAALLQIIFTNVYEKCNEL